MNAIKNDAIDKVYFVSDIHLGWQNAELEWIENVTDYFDKFYLPLVRQDVILGANPCIIIAGDFFTDRQKLELFVMHTGYEIMTKMSEICPVYIVIGNHDIYKKSDTDITSLDIFRGMDNVTIIDDVATLEIAAGRKIMMVSWVGDHVSETKILSEQSGDADVIVLHTEISGMKMDKSRPIIGGVNTSAVTNKRIYSGHIHTRQDNMNVTYLGSPYDLTRTDIGNIKGVYTITVQNGMLIEEFTENTFSPRFVSYRYSDLAAVKDLSELIRNNYVDIYVKDGEATQAQLKKFYAAVEAACPKKVEYFQEAVAQIVIDETAVADANLGVEDVSSDAIQAQPELTEHDKAALAEMNNYYLKLATEQLGGTL